MPGSGQREADASPPFTPLTASDAHEGLNRLWPAVIEELRRLAHRRLAVERTGHTLSTTALVHEVYLKLLNDRSLSSAHRQQFLVTAARAMRRILVDYARRHRAARRGGDARKVPLHLIDEQAGGDAAQQLAIAQRAEELLALDEALEAFARVNPRAAQVVEYRFFGGLSDRETAEALGITERTVGRDWVKARAWLHTVLRNNQTDTGPEARS